MIRADLAQGRVATVHLRAALESVATQLPGISDDHLTRAEELLQGLIATSTGQFPAFVDRQLALDAVVVLGLAQHALRLLLERRNVALAASSSIAGVSCAP